MARAASKYRAQHILQDNAQILSLREPYSEELYPICNGKPRKVLKYTFECELYGASCEERVI
jgi:hypothetical protein